jgi:predicted type IV restriction endonuclease
VWIGDLKMFESFDFTLLDNPNFKEDSVREVIIAPILKELGFSEREGGYTIIRSKNLTHPFIQTGSTKRQIKLIPDYTLTINDRYFLVLDAKAPNENIISGKNIEQVYGYATHPEIRVQYFALCNGREFSLFTIYKNEPLLYFKIKDINQYFEKLKSFFDNKPISDNINRDKE